MVEQDHYLDSLGNMNATTGYEDANATDMNDQTLLDRCAVTAYSRASTYVRSRLVIDVGVVLLLCVFGLAGNALSFSVLGKMKGGTTSWLLRSLAVADSAYLFTCILFQAGITLQTYVDGFRHALPLYPYVERWVWSLASMAQMASVWIVILVTANRWLAICHPLRAKHLATNRRACVGVFVVVIFSIIFNIPTVSELHVVRTPLACENGTRLAAMATQLAHNPTYQLVYKTILCFLFRALIPVTILTFLNVQLVRAVRSSASHDGKISQQHGINARDRVTILVVAIVTFVIACELPDLTFRLLLAVKLYGSTQRITWGQLAYLGMFVNLMFTLNAAVNFLIYFFVGKTFRQCLVKQCCGQGGVGRRWYRAVTTSSSKSTATTSLKGAIPV